MQRVLTNSQMRAADDYTINKMNIPSQVLMRRAGLAIADVVAAYAESTNAKEILVACGTGNNGGDGYVCAEELKRRGFNVKVYAMEGKLSGDCAREKATYSGEYSQEISADIIVDCLFGTGLCRTVTGKYAEVIAKINSSDAYIISADIPSGLNGDNGLVEGCAVKADVTIALAEYKAGYFLNDGPDYCNVIVKKDIGIICPENEYIHIYEDGDIKKFYPKRKRNSHKGTYGTAELIAGSDRYIGAAALSSGAALKSGCGFVKLVTTEKVTLSLAAKLPQVIYSDKYDLSVDCIAIGMGCSVSRELYDKIGKILKEYKGTLIIDADGLNVLAKFGISILKGKSCKVILTPHMGEFSRLCGISVSEISENPIQTAKKFADEFGVVLLLKSAVSILTDGERLSLLTRGNTALSKGGSGDLLAGYICGSAARGLEPFEAAACAAYTLGVTAEICSAEKTEYCVTARDIIKNLHLAVKRLTV